MKRFLLIISFLYSLATVAQTYNNEWIDFNKTYYKFKVGATGLYRISEATLVSLGIGAAPAEHFQLWRNGKEVSMYTSAASGPLGGGGYIEFWGLMNDGKPDKQLYRNPDYQLIDKYSFSTDTAAYFLTVNPAGGNARLVTTINNVAGNSLPPEPYFMHTEGHYCKNYMNPGYFIDAGEYVHSSTYDRGENWVCFDIGANASFSKTTDPLYVYAAGPAGTFTLNVAGNAINTRRIRARINGDSILGQNVDFLNYARLQAPVPLTSLSTPTAQIQITNVTPSGYDRMVISQFELTYPRTFNFGNKKNFEFSLPGNVSGNYLEISNFDYGATAPVLYDITNGKRYVADISTPGLIKFALEPSVLDRQLVLVSQDASNINNVSSMTQKNFVNFANASLHGDYIIISNPILYSGVSGNPVEDYRVYRSSAAGGGYNAKVYDVNELIDQFAFGIKKHPASVRNFLSWAKNNFGTRPKFVFLIGRAMMYDHYRYYESVPEADLLNLVPTYGSPASDWLLATDSGQYLPHTPIGRIAAIAPDEVSVYLSKVIEYEDAQKVTSPLIADKDME
ncbi:MAG: hypothetical protein HC867_02925 [Bacteroidia bacterium]|nr:hypothetical protein [Bacteroidia bacterium]